MYFIVYRRLDEPRFRLISKETFLKELADGDFGGIGWEEHWPADKKYGFDLTEFPVYTGYIIKGELVVPKPVEVVKSYELK